MLGESLENYLEAILLLEKNGEVRSIDLANHMKVSRPSVNKAVNALKSKGFISQEAYGSIFFTEEGRSVANTILQKHFTITKFLVESLGLEVGLAEDDACRIEHVISETTYKAMIEFIKNKG